MQQRERRAHVVDQRARLAPRQRRALGEVAAVEQLHRVERPGFVEAVVVDLDHARMRELRERVELGFEQRDDGVAALIAPAATAA